VLQRSSPERVPGPARATGGWRLATLTQPKKVEAGTAGSVMRTEAVSGVRTSGTSAARMRVLVSADSGGGQ
jgi:hypothetical protein